LRDYRLPDSAIDLVDEAGARLRMQTAQADEPAGAMRTVSTDDIEGVVARIYFSADNNVPHRWDPETLSYLPIVADSDGGEF
jgi:hypothetical protein